MRLQPLFIVACLLTPILCAPSGWAAGDAELTASAPSKAEITVLYDAFGKPSDMIKDLGFSALIEYGGRHILFDPATRPRSSRTM